MIIEDLSYFFCIIGSSIQILILCYLKSQIKIYLISMIFLMGKKIMSSYVLNNSNTNSNKLRTLLTQISADFGKFLGKANI